MRSSTRSKKQDNKAEHEDPGKCRPDQQTQGFSSWQLLQDPQQVRCIRSQHAHMDPSKMCGIRERVEALAVLSDPYQLMTGPTLVPCFQEHRGNGYFQRTVTLEVQGGEIGCEKLFQADDQTGIDLSWVAQREETASTGTVERYM